MKEIVLIFVFVFGLLVRQTAQAQGTTYLSNLNQPSAGSFVVGSDSWLAFSFATGNNASGYDLNSIELGMADASGSPSGFSAMLYSSFGQVGYHLPTTSLGTLNGSLNPTSNGIYTYDPASSMTLSATTVYFIVLTSVTTVAKGAYDWSYSRSSYDPSGGWRAPTAGFGVDNYQSSDGSSWNYLQSTGYAQFAINATPVPEPSASWLLLLGGGGFLICARPHKPQHI